MEKRLRTVFTDAGLKIEPHGPELELLSGAMHYWRVDRRHWRDCLRAMQGLGLQLVETYVPWAVHEEARGRFAWSGDRDLGMFLETVRDLGMFAIVRPGPHINAELTHFGFPTRVLGQAEVQAVSGRGTPVWLPAPPRMFPVPSYASAAFRREVEAWFAAVGEVVAPHLAPDGPVVAVQVDNEMQMFFRAGAYDADYHPDALAWWRDVAGDVDAPRIWDAADAERCVRWVMFKDEYTARALAWLTEALAAAGLGELARFHNVPPTDPTFVDGTRLLAGLGGAPRGAVGMDFYHRAADYARYRERALYLAGSSEPLPLAPEVGVGGPLWLPPMTAADQASVIAGLIGAGVRGLNFYMTVDRDRWYGAPIAMDGTVREPGSWLATLIETLRAAGWTRLRRRAPVAVVAGRTEARFAIASSVADPLTPVLTDLLELGPAGAAELAADPSAREQRRFAAAVREALALAQIPYDVVDEGASAAVLARYRAVIVPTMARVDRALWRRLRDLDGVTVIAGPERPERDELDRPLGDDAALPPRSGLMKHDSVADVEGLAADLEAVVADVLGEHWVTEEALGVDCSVLEDDGGRARLVTLGNRSGDALTADVVVPPGVSLRDPFGGPPVTVADDLAEVALGPWQVRLLVVDGP